VLKVISNNPSLINEISPSRVEAQQSVLMSAPTNVKSYYK